MNNTYLKVSEVAERIGVTEAYVRELLNRAKTDSSMKLKGVKVGKEWRILSSCVDEYLGVNKSNQEQERELYIKELEFKIEQYEIKIKSVVGMMNSITQIIKQS